MNKLYADEGHQHRPVCVQCCSSEVVNHGKLPTAQFSEYNVNGRDVALPDGGTLYTCTNCRLSFRHPTLSPEEFVEWYRYIPASSWPYQLPLHYWPTVRTWLAHESPGRRLLEIGCFRGEFLEWMRPEWTVAAVEPSVEAKSVVVSKGIRVVGDSIFDVTEQFDAIVLFDVAEHLTNPVETMRAIRDRLAPRGVVVVLTGNADAPTFRLLGRHYWYAMYLQHVVFHTPQSIRYLASLVDLPVNRGQFLPHGRTSRTEWLHEGLYAVIAALRHSMNDYNGTSTVLEHLRHVPKLRHFVYMTDRPFAWMSARDHMLVMLKSK